MASEVRANTNPLGAVLSDASFRKLAEHIPTLCWIADASGYIVWYNPRWYEYTGTTPASMEGWGWQSVHDRKTLPVVLERWTEAINSAQPFEMVFPIRGADGIFRPFLTRIIPTFDARGAVDNWFGVNTDISLQIQAEEAAAKSEARFRVIADSMPQVVWSARPDGTIDYFNARWYEFTGLPIGSIDAAGWGNLLHPADRDRTLGDWHTCVASGSPFYQEYRLRHCSGNYRWVLGRADAEQNTHGVLLRWYGTCTDIEEIVQARGVLQHSRDELERQVRARTGERDLLATLVETTDVLIMAVDLDYNILAINKANADVMERIYGVRGRVGTNLLALLADQPEQQAAVKAAWARGIAGEEITLIEPHGDPARQRNMYEIKFRPLFNEAGERIGAFQFVQDVTERLRDQAKLAQAQDALLQSQKLDALGRLTGGVAHDFNNLLSPIMGSLDILQRRGVGGAREQRLIEAAYQSADRARTLVQRLLAFARRQPLQSTVVDLGSLVRGLTGLLVSTLGPQIGLTIDVAAGVAAARVDPNQLELALLNLAVNARDAMSGVGSIRIALINEIVAADQVNELKSGRYVRLTVADTGSGMDEATRIRAVEPFFSTKGIGKGTGLGLSMAHGLASQLGGALTIASQLGQGTEVSIWLPATSDRVQPTMNEGGNVTPAISAGNVLLVDDEETIRLTTGDMLTELGFTVHEAVSGKAALEAIEAGLQPDLLVTDHLMPDMTGVELAAAVRARHPAPKILIISGFAEVGGIDPSLPRLTKPFLQSDLAAAIADLRVK